MATKISDFYEDSSKKFTITIYYNNVIQDIRNDTVTMVLKRFTTHASDTPDLSVNGDVSTAGVSGQAIFTLIPSVTNIKPDLYQLEVNWVRADNSSYVIHRQMINVLNRL